MANDCCGEMKVVSRKRSAIKRFSRIMQYKDKEYYLYRVFQFDECWNGKELSKYGNKRGLWVAHFGFDVAWSSHEWFHGTEDFNNRLTRRDKLGRLRKLKAHYSNIPVIAKALGIGVELFSTEPGCCFAEHAVCDAQGNFSYETENYEHVYPEDKNGDPDWEAEPTEVNGFGEAFMDFASAEEIYEGTAIS